MMPRALRIGAEAFIIFALLLSIDHGLLSGRAFEGFEPNPYWVPVLLLALAYGTGMGLLAAAIATAIWLVAPHARPVGEDQLEMLLSISLLPMLWVIVALVIGEVTASRRSTMEEMEQRGMELEQQQQHIGETLATLSQINRDLQVRIATENLTVGDAIEAAVDLLSGKADIQIAAIERLIALAAQTEDFTFFDVRDTHAVARFRGREAGNGPSHLSRTGLAKLMIACPILTREQSGADYDAAPCHEGVSLPIRTGNEGQLTGLLLIHSLPPGRLTQAKIAELSHVAETLGKMPAFWSADEDHLIAAEWRVEAERVA